MIRRIPLLPTLLVLIAVGVMLRMGLWQLERLQEKEAMLGRFTAAQAISAEAPWSGDEAEGRKLLFRRGHATCASTLAVRPMAGHNAQGVTGWAQVQQCNTVQGHHFDVVTGWTQQPTGLPATPGKAAGQGWAGGVVRGWIAPGAGDAVRLIADPPLLGLEANARPDPVSIPNNHLSYAVQWFLFAGVALVIYGLALRKRLAAAATPR